MSVGSSVSTMTGFTTDQQGSHGTGPEECSGPAAAAYRQEPPSDALHARASMLTERVVYLRGPPVNGRPGWYEIPVQAGPPAYFVEEDDETSMATETVVYMPGRLLMVALAGI